MSLRSHAGAASSKLIAILVAIATAAALMVVGTGTAAAANRDWLRGDNSGTCDWDGAGYWVQRCDVWSQAMGRNIPVQIQPAERGGNASAVIVRRGRSINSVSGVVDISSMNLGSRDERRLQD